MPKYDKVPFIRMSYLLFFVSPLDIRMRAVPKSEALVPCFIVAGDKRRIRTVRREEFIIDRERERRSSRIEELYICIHCR